MTPPPSFLRPAKPPGGYCVELGSNSQSLDRFGVKFAHKSAESVYFHVIQICHSELKFVYFRIEINWSHEKECRKLSIWTRGIKINGCLVPFNTVQFDLREACVCGTPCIQYPYLIAVIDLSYIFIVYHSNFIRDEYCN